MRASPLLLFTAVATLSACKPSLREGVFACSAAADCPSGWICRADSRCYQTTSVYVVTCGDGIVEQAEACDDGNVDSSDGCSANCQQESGWACAGEPSTCALVCGNALLDAGETCDDGDRDNGDGCNDACVVENGFHCLGTPSVCTTTCGDGLVVGSEDCDDGDLGNGDGCDASCAVEHGFYCLGTPSVCTTTCGDGLVASSEDCDDGDLDNGDGCDSACKVEGGWSCTGEPATCTRIPGLVLALTPENGALSGSVFAPAGALTRRPRFRWLEPSPNLSGSFTYDIEVDDSCTTPGYGSCAFVSPEAQSTGIAGLTWRPATPLSASITRPVGRRYYWRVRACHETTCGAWSKVRYLDVGRAANDFDGDGYSDIVVGATLQDDLTPTVDVGRAYVYSGGSAHISNTPSTTLDTPTPQANGHFASSVASAGDVNADGYADLIVGASGESHGASGEGAAYIFLGGSTGLTALNTIVLDNPEHHAGARFGVSVATAGDVNGDGYADVVVGADYFDGVQLATGKAFVYYGGSDGINTSSVQRWVKLDKPLSGEGAFGRSVASAGDLDGDGFSDLVVGAEWQTGAASREGKTFVYYGSSTGVSSATPVTLDNPTGCIWGEFGYSVAGAGDLNGDGYADLVVGAVGQSGGANISGNAYVYFGRPGGILLTPNTTIWNPTDHAGGHFGSSVAAAGDLDDDGFADLLVGAFDQDDGLATDAVCADTQCSEGNAFVYYGSASGVDGSVGSASRQTLDNPANEKLARFGTCVVGAGDLDADGHPDVAVGAPLQSVVANDQVGKVFFFYGTSSGIAATPDGALTNPMAQFQGGFGQCLQ